MRDTSHEPQFTTHAGTATAVIDVSVEKNMKVGVFSVSFSDLNVPVAGLPTQALERGAHLIVVYNTPTYVNVRADVVILGDVASVLPEIAKRVLHG